MMKKIKKTQKAALFLGLGLFLVSCAGMSPPGPTQPYALFGAWVSPAGRYLVLAPDGMLELPGQPRLGKSWDLEGDALILTSTDEAGANPREERLRVLGGGESRLLLTDVGGNKETWRRADKRIAAFNGVLTYRERMALPEHARVQVMLYHEGAASPFASSLSPALGQGEISCTVHYVAEEAGAETALVRAAILVGGVPYLATPEPVPVHLNRQSRILLRRAAQSPENAGLADSYWRLARLDGRSSQTWPGQTEAHVIFRSDGQAVGSDGCNNFFGGWQASGGKLTIDMGGSTLKMCLQGMDQAKAMVQALRRADAWSVQGNTLTLSSENNILAIFEAVAL